MNMAHIFLDAETIPLVSDEIRLEVAASVSAPENYGEEAAAKWMATKGAAKIETELARGGLDATRGKVLCFTYAIDSDPPVCITGDELSILAGALEVMIYNPTNLYVGHNIAGFDLPFLRQRCWVNGLAVPNKPFKCKVWDDCIADTMLAWSPERDRRISLDRLCRVLGVPSPKANGFSGADVWPAYQRGEMETIRNYALADVVATRACYRRMC